MAEAIYCRIKVAFILGLFALPVVLSMWNRFLDAQLEEVRYLPPLTPFEMASLDEDRESAELVDLTDSFESAIP